MSHRPGTISKSRSRCQTPVRNLQHPPNPKIRTYRHRCCFNLHLQNQDRDKSWIMDVSKTREGIISKSRSRCSNPVRILKHPPLNTQMRTKKTWMFFAPSKSG